MQCGCAQPPGPAASVGKGKGEGADHPSNREAQSGLLHPPLVPHVLLGGTCVWERVSRGKWASFYSRSRLNPESQDPWQYPRPSFPLSFLKAPETRLGKAAQLHRPEPRPGLSWAPSVRGHRLAVSCGACAQPRPGQGRGALRPARAGRRAREKGENLSALTGSGGGCSKRLRLAVEAASGSALT